MGLFTKWGKWQDVGIQYNHIDCVAHLLQCQTSDNGKKRFRKVFLEKYINPSKELAEDIEKCEYISKS